MSGAARKPVWLDLLGRHPQQRTNRGKGRPALHGEALAQRDVPIIRSTIITDDYDLLSQTITVQIRAVGRGKRGNGRRGATQLYADLALAFVKMQHAGVTPPSDGCLSVRACAPRFGLLEALRRNGLEPDTSFAQLHDRHFRNSLAHRHWSVFRAVRNAMRTPP